MKTFVCILSGVLFVPVGVWAQNEIASSAIQNTFRTLEDPSLTSPARRTNFQATLNATQSASEAAIELGFSCPGQPGRFRTTLKLSGPVNKQEDRTELATLDGLAGRTKLTLGVTYLSRTEKEVVTTVTTNIQNAIDAPGFLKKIEAACLADNPGNPDCGSTTTNDLSPGARRRFLKGMGATGGSFFFASEATYSAPETFKFVVPATLERKKEQHDGFSGRASFGWLPIVSPLPYVGLTFTYEDIFVPASPQQVCEPLNSIGALRCSNLALAPPTESKSSLLQLELRRYLPQATAALGLRVTRDIENDVTGIELPFWVVRDASGMLNGGIAAGWRSDTETWTLSAFVGSPFGSKGRGE